MINAVLMNKNDSVATVTEDIRIGDSIKFVLNGEPITIISKADIPIYHKVAIKNIKVGEDLFKYGEKIGYSTKDIKVGDHVHSHNLDS